MLCKYLYKRQTRALNIERLAPGGTPHNRLYREAPPEMGTFLRRLQVYKRVGVLQVEAYIREGKIGHLGCSRLFKHCLKMTLQEFRKGGAVF